MTKDYDELIKALDTATPKPRKEARAEDTSLALAAFDEINPPKHAETDAGSKSAGRGLLSRVLDYIPQPKLVIPGALVASSVLAVAIVSNINFGPNQPMETVASAPTSLAPKDSVSEPAELARSAQTAALVEFALIGSPNATDAVEMRDETRALSLESFETAPAGDVSTGLSEQKTFRVSLVAKQFSALVDGAPGQIVVSLGGLIDLPARFALVPVNCPADVVCKANSIEVVDLSSDEPFVWTEAFVCRGAAAGLSAEFEFSVTNRTGARAAPQKVTLLCTE